MALPRPALLAIAGVMLSLLSFTVMRSLGATSAEDFALPASAPYANATHPAKDKDKSKDNGQTEQVAVKPPPVPKLADVPGPVANALADGKVVVLLFVEPGAAEDAATAQSFAALSGLGGVKTFKANIAKVGDYAGIVANLGISQAPAIVIVRPDLQAEPPIEGYVESGYLLQRVKDQLP